jgi:dipeptidyl aminopeptidase/acylaminoacyl peptidase
MPPTLIDHGDADTLTPLDQSERFCFAAKDVGTEIQLVVHPGGGHGWLTLPFDFVHFVDWFDQHLQSPGTDQ